MKILIILPRFPYPLEKGDKLRAYNQIRSLSENNEIYLFALSHQRVGEEMIAEMRRYCKDIKVVRLSKVKGLLRVVRNFLSIRSLQIGYWDSCNARRQYRQFEAEVKPDVIYAQMIRTIKYAAHSEYPKVMDFQDSLSMNMERRMLQKRGLLYFILHYEFKMLRSAEFNACGIFDRMTIISERDSEAIPQHKNTEIDIIRNGVDFDYFHPMEMPKEYDIVFCGNMQYHPNIDASRFLVDEVMPIVWKSHPQARLLLAGATPKNGVRQLATSRVTVSGTVDDIRPCYASAHVFVAPMRVGSGLQNKILEAMSMGIPCVTTSIVNVSIGAKDGEEIIIADDANAIAASIVRLLDDESLRHSLATEAGKFVRERFSWRSAGDDLQAVLQKAITTHIKHEEEQLEEE